MVKEDLAIIKQLFIQQGKLDMIRYIQSLVITNEILLDNADAYIEIQKIISKAIKSVE